MRSLRSQQHRIPARVFRVARGLAALIGLVTSLGCDESFSPIQPSDRLFSIHGVLNASADTQWVRVMPLRPLILTTPEPLDATVSLEHMPTGRIIELHDSVFRFSTNPDVGSEGAFLHNFWTTEAIEPGASYRFVAAKANGESSEALVEVAPDYSVEVWHGTPLLLHLEGLEHVAYTKTTYYYDDCGSVVDDNLLSTRSASGGVLDVPLTKQFRTRYGCGTARVEKQEVLVVGTGEPWPSGREYSTSALGVTDAPSNVSNALGFLGGVLTKVAPLENCSIASFSHSRDAYCKLRYDAAAATLRGTVSDLVCGGTVAAVEVALLEVNPDSPLSRKRRWTYSGRGGGFEMGALEAGRRYALSASKLSRDGQQLFEPVADTVELAAGEQRTHDLYLVPVNQCGAES